MTISIVIITGNEEANIERTLRSVLPLLAHPGGEMIIVDSESTDRTAEIAAGLGAKVFIEPWKGFGSQKNSAIDKARCDWVLQLDADESVPPALIGEIREAMATAPPDVNGFSIPRMNHYFGRWIRRGGYWPDRKARLFRRSRGRATLQAVHEGIVVDGKTLPLTNGLFHNGYPTVGSFVESVDSYSTLKAEMLVESGYRGFSIMRIVISPIVRFLHDYVIRGGFLDGKQGLLTHLYRAVYVSLSYAKAWEKSCPEETSLEAAAARQAVAASRAEIVNRFEAPEVSTEAGD